MKHFLQDNGCAGNPDDPPPMFSDCIQPRDVRESDFESANPILMFSHLGRTATPEGGANRLPSACRRLV